MGKTRTAGELVNSIFVNQSGTTSFTGSLRVSGSSNIIGSLNATSLTGSLSYTNLTSLPTLVSGSEQVTSILTSLNTYTGSNDTTNTAQNSRLSSLETKSGSVDSSISNINSFTSSNGNTSLNDYSSSLKTAISIDGANLTLLGNLKVQGTTTTVDSTTVQIGDNIIELNGTGATNGGLLVKDPTAPNTVSGSLLWDSTNDYWKGGALDFESKLLRAGGDNVVSGSSQVTPLLPSGTVSGSSQVTLSSTTGFGTYINQAVLTTSSPTFVGGTFTGALAGTSATFSGNVIFDTTDRGLVSNTVDGSDNKFVSINGGGARGDTRGGTINLFGNEATGTGRIDINAGDVVGGVVNLVTQGLNRLTVNRDGNVGIGTTSPDASDWNASARLLHIYQNTTNGSVLKLESSNTSGVIGAGNNAMALGTTTDDPLLFYTNTTERMRITSDGNVGIGTTTPNLYSLGFSRQFTVSNTTASAYSSIAIAGGAGGGGGVDFGNQTVRHAGIFSLDVSGIALYTNSTNSGANITERMRITSAGETLFNTTSNSATSGTGFKILTNGEIPAVVTAASTDGGRTSYTLYSTGAGAFRFYVGAGGTIFATSTSISAISDISLKTNIRNLDKGLDEIMKLKPRRFDWKNGDNDDVMGFIAQEVEEIFPELIGEYMYNKTDSKKSLKMGDLLPSLVKAIQELKAEIDLLKGIAPIEPEPIKDLTEVEPEPTNNLE